MDAFGVGRRERLLRRLVGAALASWIYAVIFGLWVFPPTVILAATVAYLLALPLSYVLERRWPGRRGRATLVRYGLLGAVFGCVAVAIVLQALPWVWAIVAAAIGAASGGIGAWAATRVPTRWVAPVATVGTTLTLGVVGVVIGVALLP